MADELLEAWIFPRGFDLGSITLIAQERLAPADLRGHLVSSRGDVVTLQVIEGKSPTASEFLLYVSGRGAFEILRREDWRGDARRTLLVLSAWPRR